MEVIIIITLFLNDRTLAASFFLPPKLFTLT